MGQDIRGTEHARCFGIKPQRPDSDGLDISRGRTVVQAEGLEEGQKRRAVDVAKEDMKFMASREA